VKFEDVPYEWHEWVMLTLIQLFRASEEIVAQYLALGGTLDPASDPTRPLLTMQKHQVQAWLMGGQACVFYGAAQLSKEVDFLILAEAGLAHREPHTRASRRTRIPLSPRRPGSFRPSGRCSPWQETVICRHCAPRGTPKSARYALIAAPVMRQAGPIFLPFKSPASSAAASVTPGAAAGGGD